MGLLAYGDTGWGDELFFATLMTIAVAATASFSQFYPMMYCVDSEALVCKT